MSHSTLRTRSSGVSKQLGPVPPGAHLEAFLHGEGVMAVRYSGEVEIRIKHERGLYHVSYKAPGIRGGGKLTARECKLSPKEPATSPDAYDKVAERVVAFLRLKGVPTGEVRRVFQAPCPIPLR